MVTSEERERMIELCNRIVDETDHKKFTELVLELSYLLEKKGETLRSNQ